MYENKRVRRRLLILRLIVRCALWSEKYGICNRLDSKHLKLGFANGESRRTGAPL